MTVRTADGVAAAPAWSSRRRSAAAPAGAAAHLRRGARLHQLGGPARRSGGWPAGCAASARCGRWTSAATAGPAAARAPAATRRCRRRRRRGRRPRRRSGRGGDRRPVDGRRRGAAPGRPGPAPPGRRRQRERGQPLVRPRHPARCGGCTGCSRRRPAGGWARGLVRLRLGEPWLTPPPSPLQVVERDRADAAAARARRPGRVLPPRALPRRWPRRPGPSATAWVVPGFGHAESGATAPLVERIGRWASATINP